MSNTYEINDRNEVIPYTSGRRCLDTRAWRDATELEIQQRDEIARLESEVETLEAKIDELQDSIASDIDFARGLEEELNEALRCNDIMAAALAEIKATNEGKSNQSIKDIINGCILELKNE